MLPRNHWDLCNLCNVHTLSHAGIHTLTQQDHEADADGKQGAEAESYVLPIDGQRHLTVAPPVSFGAVAGELRG